MHQHEKLLRTMDEAMAKGDMETFFGSYTDDVVVHIPGHSSLAGDHKGLDQMQALFGRFMEGAGEYSFEAHGYIVDDEHGIILQRSKMSKGGKTLETNDIFVNHFRDGKISEFWMYSDKQQEMDAWLD